MLLQGTSLQAPRRVTLLCLGASHSPDSQPPRRCSRPPELQAPRRPPDDAALASASRPSLPPRRPAPGECALRTASPPGSSCGRSCRVQSTNAQCQKETVAKDIKYADHQPIVPWGPRYSRSTAKDLRINMAISASFIMCISTMGHADWKPLRFLCFAYFYRILEKLKATEPAVTPVYNVRSMVRLKVGVYTWQNECSVVWVWYLDQYLLHPWATLDWPISLSFLGSIFYLLFIISRS